MANGEGVTGCTWRCRPRVLEKSRSWAESVTKADDFVVVVVVVNDFLVVETSSGEEAMDTSGLAGGDVGSEAPEAISG